MATTYDRISARCGNYVNLEMAFMHSGVLADPHAITKVEIYKSKIAAQNLVSTVIVADRDGTEYPAPIEFVRGYVEGGYCGTDPDVGAIIPGKYQYLWAVPVDAAAPDVYYDVWYYNVEQLGNELTALSSAALRACGRFWVYPDNWSVQDGLSTIRLGFEPLDQKFRQPEKRNLEVGLMPLPLYDYDHNLVDAVLPYATATITVETFSHEVLINNEPMSMGLRQGAFRSNPFVLQYTIDTTAFLRGTYRYRITVKLPDGSSISSGDFALVIM